MNLSDYSVGDVLPTRHGGLLKVTGYGPEFLICDDSGAWVVEIDEDGQAYITPYGGDTTGYVNPANPRARQHANGNGRPSKPMTWDEPSPDMEHVQTLNGDGPGSMNGDGAADEDYQSSFKPLPMRALLARQFKPQEFLVEGLIAKGNFAIAGGRAKSGKSWFFLQLAMCIDSGLPFLGRATLRAPVLYYALEDGERRLQSRAIALGWQPSEHAAVLFSIANLDDGAGGPGPGIDELWSHTRDYDLIVIDTLTAAMSGKTDERDNSAMGAIINSLAQIAHQTDKTILLIHHTGKATNQDDIFFTLRGASAIRGAYDLGLILQRKPGEREAILHTESRDLDVPKMTLRQADDGAGWDYLGDSSELEKVRAGRQVLETMLEQDANNEGLTAKQLAELRKVKDATIYKQLQKLEEGGYIYRDKQPATKDGKQPDIWHVKEDFRVASPTKRPIHKMVEMGEVVEVG